MTGQHEWFRQQRIARNRAERLEMMAEAQRQAEQRNAQRDTQAAR
ncbi:hypothetical protein [Micromonospora carbonacea]